MAKYTNEYKGNKKTATIFVDSEVRTLNANFRAFKALYSSDNASAKNALVSALNEDGLEIKNFNFDFIHTNLSNIFDSNDTLCIVKRYKDMDIIAYRDMLCGENATDEDYARITEFVKAKQDANDIRIDNNDIIVLVPQRMFTANQAYNLVKRANNARIKAIKDAEKATKDAENEAKKALANEAKKARLIAEAEKLGLKIA